MFSRQRRRLGLPNTNWRKEEPMYRRKFHVPKSGELDWVGRQRSLYSWIKSIKPFYIASWMTTSNLSETRLETHSRQPKWPDTFAARIRKKIQFLNAAPILFSNSATEKLEDSNMKPGKKPSSFRYSMTNKLHFISHARIMGRYGLVNFRE